MEDSVMSVEDFQKCIESISKISFEISDNWRLNEVQQPIENNKYLTKKHSILLLDPDEPDLKVIATFEYHVVYSISYSVPVLSFDVWKQNGVRMTLEEYWKYGENLREYNMHDTLTQMDHPLLNRPIFTLHPCKTQEVVQGFLKTSKNPVISWLSVVSRFVHLEVMEEYLRSC